MVMKNPRIWSGGFLMVIQLKHLALSGHFTLPAAEEMYENNPRRTYAQLSFEPSSGSHLVRAV